MSQVMRNMPTVFRRLSLRAMLSLALVATIVILGIAFMPRRVSRRAEQAWLLVTGRLIDAGGHRLHVECRGTGTPTVVMDSGLNMTMETWGSVPSEAATFTRVCTYDRAGLDFSEAGPEPRTSKRIVSELHTLLDNAGVGGPYVLVGHSFGGLNMRLYASLYPKEVAGIVLVDASHEAQYERFASLKLPGEREEYLRHESGGNYEGVDLLASAAEVREAPPLPAVPVLVLTARQSNQEDPRVREAFEQMQAELAKLAPNSKQIIAENSGHFIQLDRHFLVTDSIFVVVQAARNHAASL